MWAPAARAEWWNPLDWFSGLINAVNGVFDSITSFIEDNLLLVMIVAVIVLAPEIAIVYSEVGGAVLTSAAGEVTALSLAEAAAITLAPGETLLTFYAVSSFSSSLVLAGVGATVGTAALLMTSGGGAEAMLVSVDPQPSQCQLQNTVTFYIPSFTENLVTETRYCPYGENPKLPKYQNFSTDCSSIPANAQRYSPETDDIGNILGSPCLEPDSSGKYVGIGSGCYIITTGLVQIPDSQVKNKIALYRVSAPISQFQTASGETDKSALVKWFTGVYGNWGNGMGTSEHKFGDGLAHWGWNDEPSIIENRPEENLIGIVSYSAACSGNTCIIKDSFKIPENSYVLYAAKILGDYSTTWSYEYGCGDDDTCTETKTYNSPAKFLSAKNPPIEGDLAMFPWIAQGAYTMGDVLWGPIPTSALDCPVDGVCGSSKGQILTSVPTTGLCDPGSPSGMAGSGHPWTWSCAGTGGGAAVDCSAELVPPPVVDLKVNGSDSSIPVNYNSVANVSWSVSGVASSCTASGGWSGSKSIAGGSENSGNITSDNAFSLYCDGPGGKSNVDSATATIVPPPTNPNYSCAANGKSAAVSWTKASGYDGLYLHVKNPDSSAYYDNDNYTSSSYNLASITPDQNYTWWVQTRDPSGVYSNSAGGTFSCSPGDPTVQLKVNNSHSPAAVAAPANLAVSWSTTVPGRITSCVGAGQGWNGPKSKNGGNDSGGNLNNISAGNYTYNITCNKTTGGTISDNVSLIVNVNIYALTVATAGAGTVIGPVGTQDGISCGTNCSENYTSGTPITLTAASASGSAFTGWSGCDSVSGNTCMVTVNGAKSVTANFAAKTLNVSLSVLPSAGSRPLNSTLTATVAGTAVGTINYTFYCDRNDNDTNITAGWDGKYDGQAANTKSHTCAYSSIGAFSPKVIVERDSNVPNATDKQTVTVTNSAPAAGNLSASQPNYCAVGPATTFSWIFSDSDPGDAQSAYQVQADNNSNFSSPEFDTAKVGSVASAAATPAGVLAYNNTYYWRVKVWDNHDLASSWGATASFATPKHQYPTADFYWAPTFPSVDENVQFADQSAVFGGATKQSWQWSLPGSTNPNSTVQNPLVKFNSNGNKSVNLTVTDSDDYACSLTSPKTVQVRLPLPGWKEIAP